MCKLFFKEKLNANNQAKYKTYLIKYDYFFFVKKVSGISRQPFAQGFSPDDPHRG